MTIGPFPQWNETNRIVSIDPWGHLVAEEFRTEIAEGIDIRPTIAITKARLELHEMRAAIAAGRLKTDGKVVFANASLAVVKIAIDPVWYLPGIALRFGCTETSLRRTLFEQTAGMFPELVTRPDLQVFLPPIGGTTVYLLGDVERLADPRTKITCRMHDECNGSDVFGSDICTCRPYLIHGIEECAGGAVVGPTLPVQVPEPDAVAHRDALDFRGEQELREILDLPPGTGNRVTRQPVQVDHHHLVGPVRRDPVRERFGNVEVAEVEIFVEHTATVQFARQSGEFGGQTELPLREGSRIQCAGCARYCFVKW